jgi:hypothetical protein
MTLLSLIDNNAFLGEALSTPYKFNKIGKGTYTFHAADDDIVIVNVMDFKFADDSSTSMSEITFTRNGSHRVTGDGDALRIFSTVIEIVKNVASKEKPAVIILGADKDEKKRKALYQNIVKSVLAKNSQMHDYQILANINNVENEKLHAELTTLKDNRAFDYVVLIRKELLKESVEILEKQDLKAEAIGLATEWFKQNYKSFSLPLKTMRIPTSGNYIMAATVTNPKWDKPQRIYVTVVKGEVHQTTLEQWNEVVELKIASRKQSKGTS